MDQAERLRQLIDMKRNNARNRFKVITVSSGKGGVGKTNFVINLAIALQKRGIKVGILDADFGMANVDILFGIRANYSIYDILYNNKEMRDVEITTSEGIKIIPGGSGIKEFTEINEFNRQRLMNEFSKINNIDVLLVDTGAGLSKTVLNFIEVADEVIVVTNSEPTSLTDAYGLIKVVIKSNIKSNINLVINKVRNVREANETYEKLEKTIETFLNRKIKYMGFIADDYKVSQAVKEQKPFMSLYPKSEASLCIQRISTKLLGETENTKNQTVKDYFNKLLNVMRG